MYKRQAFDLEKLKAFDPKGVAEFRKEWNLPDKKPVKKKGRGIIFPAGALLCLRIRFANLL